MEVCGTHTMAIARFGIKAELPKNVELISGPGCPVCVTDQRDIDRAVALAQDHNVIIATFGDMLRVPGTRGSLENARSLGAQVRVIYSCLDCLTIAREHPDKRIVFVGVGFETTSPTVAATVLEARKQRIKNLFILPYFKLVFPALKKIAGAKDLKIDGFICPGHVSVITGSRPYEELSRKFKKPCVITGFEPADILEGIALLLKLIRQGEHKVVIQYRRAVEPEGNKKALRILDKVFDVSNASWRGLGNIPRSGLKLRREFSDFDAMAFRVRLPRAVQNKHCLCGDVIRGKFQPRDCVLFAKACNPEHPIGPCMVSSEGSCAANYKYRYRNS